jgi:hypothetical protein
MPTTTRHSYRVVLGPQTVSLGDDLATAKKLRNRDYPGRPLTHVVTVTTSTEVEEDEIPVEFTTPSGYLKVTAYQWPDDKRAQVLAELREFIGSLHAAFPEIAPPQVTGGTFTIGGCVPLPHNANQSEVDAEWAARHE